MFYLSYRPLKLTAKSGIYELAKYPQTSANKGHTIIHYTTRKMPTNENKHIYNDIKNQRKSIGVDKEFTLNHSGRGFYCGKRGTYLRRLLKFKTLYPFTSITQKTQSNDIRNFLKNQRNKTTELICTYLLFFHESPAF